MGEDIESSGSASDGDVVKPFHGVRDARFRNAGKFAQQKVQGEEGSDAYCLEDTGEGAFACVQSSRVDAVANPVTPGEVLTEMGGTEHALVYSASAPALTEGREGRELDTRQSKISPEFHAGHGQMVSKACRGKLLMQVPRQFKTGVRSDVYKAHAPTTPYVEYLAAMYSTDSVKVDAGGFNGRAPLHPTRVVKHLRSAGRGRMRQSNNVRQNIQFPLVVPGMEAPCTLRGDSGVPLSHGEGHELGFEDAKKICHSPDRLLGQQFPQSDVLVVGEGEVRKVVAESLQPSFSSELYTIASAVSGGAFGLRTSPSLASSANGGEDVGRGNPNWDGDARSYSGAVESKNSHQEIGHKEIGRERTGDAVRASASASSRAGQGMAKLQFRRGRSARVLDLRHYQVGDIGAQQLAETIRRHGGRIETLVLRENNIRGRGAIAICGALAPSHRCRKLDLARNRVGVDGCRALAKAMLPDHSCGGAVQMVSTQKKRQVELVQGQLMRDGAISRQYGHFSDANKRMARGHAVNSMNKVLRTRSVDDISAAPLAWLRELDLSNNHMSSRAATVLLESIVKSSNTALTRLDLSHNNLGSHCCEAVADLIRHEYKRPLSTGHVRNTGTMSPGNERGGQARGILLLDLSWNMLKANDAPTLMEAVASTKALRFFNLAFNRLGDPGAEALATALSTNATLQEINLSYNGITCAHCNSIAAAIKSNSVSKLQLIELHGNVIGHGGLESLRNALVSSLPIDGD